MLCIVTVGCEKRSLKNTGISDIKTSDMSPVLKMDVTGWPETLFPIHQTARHHILQDYHLNLHPSGMGT